ncbi:hypothetical protein AB5N19_13601 [Seiridium cardinale]
MEDKEPIFEIQGLEWEHRSPSRRKKFPGLPTPGCVSSRISTCSILNGTRIPWDQDISEGEGDEEEATSSPQDDIGFYTEMEQISADVVEVLNCLMNLSVSIRNPAAHDRFRGSVETDTSFYEASDIAHVRAKYENADSELITLLGRANSRRRQYFKYRELHHQKLSQGLDLNFDTEKSMAGRTIVPSILKTKPLELTDIVNMDAMSDSGFTQTSYASSENTSDRPRFPALPVDSVNGPFECPFCFMMVSVTNSYAWRKHIFADLRPYNCVAVNCPIAGTEYGRRHQWMEHMLQSHWSEWHCRHLEDIALFALPHVPGEGELSDEDLGRSRHEMNSYYTGSEHSERRKVEQLLIEEERESQAESNDGTGAMRLEQQGGDDNAESSDQSVPVHFAFERVLKRLGAINNNKRWKPAEIEDRQSLQRLEELALEAKNRALASKAKAEDGILQSRTKE